MADSDQSINNLRYNQVSGELEGFGGGSPQWTQLTLNNVDPTQVPVTRLIDTTAPLTGGGNLSADRTLSIPAATSSVDGYLLHTDWTTFNNKQVAGSYITALTGDVTATGPGSVASTVVTVGTSSAVNIHTAEVAANAATNLDTVSTIVKRDGSGNFSAGTITANLTGTASAIAAHAVVPASISITNTDNFTFPAAILTVGTLGVRTSGGIPSSDIQIGYASAGSAYLEMAAAAGNQVGIIFDKASAQEWTILKQVDETFNLYDNLGSKYIWRATSGSGLNIPTMYGSVAFNDSNATANASAKVDIASTTQGVLPPRMTTTQKNAISSPAEGLEVYDTTLHAPSFYNGTSWQAVDAGVVPVASGGTNSSTALANGLAMVSSGGKIVEGTNPTNAAGYIKGTILQYQQFVDTGTTNTTSTSFVVTTTTVSITPKSSTSVIQIFVTGVMQVSLSTQSGYASIYRGTTNLGNATIGFAQVNTTALGQCPVSLQYIDTPATTSATSYTLRIATSNATSTTYWGPQGAGSNYNVITVVEIAQ